MHPTKSVFVSAVIRSLLGVPLLAAPVAGAMAQASATARQFNLPAGDAEQTLRQFSNQSGIDFLVPTDLVAGVRTNAVNGLYEPEAAAQRMLAGTSLALLRDGSGIYRIRKDTSPKAAGAVGRADEELESVVVAASRTPMELRKVSSAVSVVKLEELDAQQVGDLRKALAQQPGVIVSNTGATGGQTAVYMRGAFPQHTLFFVDGVRMNDSAAGYDNFLGGADLGGFDHIEVLRGPQSTIYGSAAMGGVILMNTSRGTDVTKGGVELGGGSFDTYTGGGAITGSAGKLSYSASLGRYETANELPDNEYHNWSYSTRLQLALAEGLDIGTTFRGQNGRFEVASGFPGIAEIDNYLGTVYADWRASDAVNSRFTAAVHNRKYTWISGGFASPQENKRYVFDWQTSWKAGRGLELVVGANAEDAEYDIGSDGQKEGILSGFLSGVYKITDTVTLNAGMRYDAYDSVGPSTTWRTGVAWNVLPDTKLRATYGTGFAAPASSQRYGVPSWGARPNPDLKPEDSRGWDIGVDQSFLDGRFTVTATWFDNRFTDLIDWTYVDFVTFEGMYTNVSKASTRGLELGVAAELVRGWHLSLGYTYLDTKNEATGERLVRRPKNAIELQAWAEITPRWTVGYGLSGVVDKLQAASWPSVGYFNDDYFVSRLYTSYMLTDAFTAKLRVENLFDRKYEEVPDYPALTRGVFASVEWRF